jgi:hypothetical protein
MSDEVRAKPGDEACDSQGWKRFGVGAIQMQSMARAAMISLASGESCCLETESETELTIGLMGADAFGGENRSGATDASHEFDGGVDGTTLRGSRGRKL